MKCYYHIDREAVATCPNCGKHLCRECASHYNPCYCEDCVQLFYQAQEEEVKQTKGSQVKGFLIRLGIGAVLILAFFASSGGDLDYVLDSLIPLVFLFCIPFGYHAATLLQNRILGKLNLIIFINIVFISIKLTTGIFIGPFAFVWELISLFRSHGTTDLNQIVEESTGVNVREGAKKASRKVGKALSSGKEKAREVYESYNSQRAARAELPTEPEITYDLGDAIDTPEVNLSKCIKPHMEVVDGSKKLQLSVDRTAFISQLGDAKEQFRSNMTALRELFDSVRPRASKTENFQSGDVVNVTIDYDWELAEELGINITGTKFRMTAK